jgi:sugar lactone lactonase YvrE
MRRPLWPPRRLAGPEKCAPASGAIALVISVAFLLSMAAVLGGALPGPAEAARGAGAADAASAAPSVHTVLGPAVVSSPAGLALDTAGDLFVADSGHCRVLVVPAKAGMRYGIRMRPGRVATVAGGSCSGPGGIGHPSGAAVDAQGDLFIAEATAQRVQELRPASRSAPVTLAGTGRAGFNGDGLAASTSELNQPASVAVDAAGDLYIADTANCRVRVLPAATTTLFGQSMVPGRLYTVAGTGVCGTTGQGGPAAAAELWSPVAVTTDSSGDLLVADTGDHSVLLAAAHAGSYFGTNISTGAIAVVVGGTGSYGPYLADGLSATGPAAELNDPRGLAIGPSGALFVTDGFMHAVRVVPTSDETLFGRAMTAGDLYTAAGAVPVSSRAGLGDGTRWELAHLGTAAGVAVAASGTMYVADSTFDAVRAITGGGTGAGA